MKFRTNQSLTSIAIWAIARYDHLISLVYHSILLAGKFELMLTCLCSNPTLPRRSWRIVPCVIALTVGNEWVVPPLTTYVGKMYMANPIDRVASIWLDVAGIFFLLALHGFFFFFCWRINWTSLLWQSVPPSRVRISISSFVVASC